MDGGGGVYSVMVSSPTEPLTCQNLLETLGNYAEQPEHVSRRYQGVFGHYAKTSLGRTGVLK